MGTLVLAALDVSLSNSRDVRPGHVVGRNRQRKLESPDQGIENGFDPVGVEYRVGNRKRTADQDNPLTHKPRTETQYIPGNHP